MEVSTRLVSYFLLLTAVGCTSVTISRNGGYRNVVVFISPDVRIPNAENFLSKLRILFNEGSKTLFLASRELFHFEHILVVLPKAFNTTAIGGVKLRGKSRTEPDVIVLQKGLFGSKPYTIQHAGCGEGGLRVHIPSVFLTASDIAHKDKYLIQEWAHYRYGVFDEHGYSGDSRYPLFHSVPGESSRSGVFSVTGCTNAQAIYRFKDEWQKTCQQNMSNCFPDPSQVDLNIVSSIMHYPFFPQTTQFCDGNKFKHNRNAVTKQNVLCREKSAWSVVQMHQDFLNRPQKHEGQNRARVPVFEYFIETEPKVMLAVETTDAMAVGDRMDSLRNAFSYFVHYNLLLNSKVGIMDMKKLNVAPSFLKLASVSDIDRLFDIFPEAYGKSEICISCAILQLTEVISNANDSDTTLVLVTSNDITATEMNTVLSAVSNVDLTLFVIFFGNTTKPLMLEELTMKTKGNCFIIADMGPNNFLSPLTVLYDAFRTISASFLRTCKHNVLIFQKVFHPYSIQNEMDFTVDESVESFHLIITGSNFFLGPPLMKDQVVLQNGEKEYHTVPPIFSYKIKIPAYLFTIKNEVAGTWKLRFQRKPQYNGTIVAIVRATHSQCSHILKMQNWIERGHNDRPIATFSEIMKGIHGVANTNVNVIAYHHMSGQKVICQLFDDGKGDPDITRNDGIYSSYLSAIQEEGYWMLTVTARSNHSNSTSSEDSNSEISGEISKCCGSYIPLIDDKAVASFIRTGLSGSFYVDAKLANKSFPPKCIVDLQIINVEKFDFNITHYTLSWTAPGNRYDVGTASKYELKLFMERDDALENFEHKSLMDIDEWKIHGPWLKPEVAGTAQIVIIELSNLTSGTYFLAMRTINTNSEASDVSNVVEIYYTMSQVPTAISIEPTQAPAITTVNPDQTKEFEKAGNNELSMIIGVSCGFLFILLVLGILLLFYLPKKRKNKKQNNMTISGPYQPKKNDKPLHALSAAVDNGNPPCVTMQPTFYEYKHNGQIPNRTNQVTSSTNQRYHINSSNYEWNDTSTQQYDSTVHILENQYLNPQLLEISSFYEVPLKDDINVPFNPMYTSSLRRQDSNRQTFQRLGTDV